MERGTANTDKFLLGTASIMIGPVGTPEVLTETTHSMGLVKDVTIEFTPTYTDLQQGVENKTVFSVKTGNDTRITGSSYEFTDKNLAYAAGLNGDDVEPVVGTPYTVSGSADDAGGDAGGVSLTVDTPTSPIPLVDGDTVVVHNDSFSVITTVVSAADLSSGTLVVKGDWAALVGMGAKVTKVNVMKLGARQKPQYVSAKIVGELPNGDVAIIMVPKTMFTSGLAMAFTSGDFSNLNLELRPTALLKSDAAYAVYGDDLMQVALASGVSND